MLGYIVKTNDTPQSIALALTGDASRFNELVAANPRLRREIVGRDMQTGQIVSTFAKNQFVQGLVLALPVSWNIRTGSVGRSSGHVGFLSSIDPGGDCSGWGDYCGDGQSCTNGVCPQPIVGGSGGSSDPGGGSDYTDPGSGGGGGGGGGGGTSTGVACDIGRDCGQGEVCGLPEHTCRKALPGEISTGGVRNCADANVISDVQTAMGMGSQADGVWGCLSKQYFDAQGQTYQQLCQGCDGPLPDLYCPDGTCVDGKCVTQSGPGPTTTKKKLGEDCVAGSECEAGLECIDGKCANPVVPKTAGGSNTLWWVLGGLAAGATVVGVAYAGGAFDSKKAGSGRGKSPAPRSNPCGCTSRQNPSGCTFRRNPIQSRVTKWHKDQFPEGIEIIDQMAKTAWTLWWAQEQEEKGRSFSGQEIMGQAPKTPAKAKEWAIGVAMQIGCMNPHLPGASSDPYWIMQSAFNSAVATGGQDDANNFGHYMAMEAMGHGVSWYDDNPEFGLKVPSHEFYM